MSGYALFETAVIGFAAAVSAYHVLKLLLPRTMRRLRVAAGRSLANRSRHGGLHSLAERLQVAETGNGCNGCSASAGCTGCGVAPSRTRLDLDSGEKRLA